MDTVSLCHDAIPDYISFLLKLLFKTDDKQNLIPVVILFEIHKMSHTCITHTYFEWIQHIVLNPYIKNCALKTNVIKKFLNTGRWKCRQVFGKLAHSDTTKWQKQSDRKKKKKTETVCK